MGWTRSPNGFLLSLFISFEKHLLMHRYDDFLGDVTDGLNGNIFQALSS